MRVRSKLPLVLVFAGPLLASASGACSFALGLGDEQCDSTADCTRRGFANAACESHVCIEALAGSSSSSPTTASSGGEGGQGGTRPVEWECLPGFVTPKPVDGETIPTEFQFVLATANPPKPAMNTVVKLCSAFDALCMSPIESAISIPETGDGKHTFDVPAGFNGYVDVTSDETVHGLAFFGSPIKIPPSTDIIRMTRPGEEAALLAIVHETAAADHGVALVLTSDCLDERSGGVKLTASPTDSTTVPFYFQSGIPSTSATETDAEGAGGFLNLPLGVVTIEARRASNNEYIGTVTFQVQDQILSYVPIGPTTPI